VPDGKFYFWEFSSETEAERNQFDIVFDIPYSLVYIAKSSNWTRTEKSGEKTADEEDRKRGKKNYKVKGKLLKIS